MTPDEFAEQYDRLIDALNSPTVTDWIAAVAAALTFLVAIGALFYAARQVREARDARDLMRELEVERSQPYVVAFMEPSEASKMFIDFVVKNYGATAAHDVRIEIEPAPKRSADNEEVAIPATIPILAPGQEWRSSWDNSRDRLDSGLPDRHEGKVTFTGVQGAERESPIVLDWSIYKARRWIEVYGPYDAAKALRDIRSYMKKWSEGPQGGLAVFARDGDAKDERKRAEYAEWKAGRDAEHLAWVAEGEQPASASVEVASGPAKESDDDRETDV